MKDDTARKVIPLVALVVILGCLVYALLPFKVAGAVKCGPALFGAEARSDVSVGLLRPPKACNEGGNSRLVNAGIVGVLALVGGAGALLSPQIFRRFEDSPG